MACFRHRPRMVLVALKDQVAIIQVSDVPSCVAVELFGACAGARSSATCADNRSQCGHFTMGWEALGRWGEDAARIEPLAGGVANDVWSVQVHGHLAIGRLGARSDADLGWETELLQHLDREGLTVPVPIPTTAGQLFADGLMVMRYVEGDRPRRRATGVASPTRSADCIG